MQREGFTIARCTVERLMREMGLQGVIRGKPVRTTVSDKAAPCPQDHVNRQFNAPAPNRLWLSDFTYVATWAGSSTSPLSSTPTPGGSSVGAPAAPRTPASSSTLWSKRSMSGGLYTKAASSITPTAGPKTCP
jgi:transposase InsO family protein